MSNWLLMVECFTVFQLIWDAQVHHSSPSWRPSFFPVGGPGVVAFLFLTSPVSGGGLPSPSSGWRRALSPLEWCPSIPQGKSRQAAPPRERGGKQHHQKEGAHQDARPKGAREACTTAQKEEVGTHHFPLPLSSIGLQVVAFFWDLPLPDRSLLSAKVRHVLSCGFSALRGWPLLSPPLGLSVTFLFF